MSGVPEVEVEELHAMVDEGQPLLLLDVREPWEIDICRLPDSVSIPLATLPERYRALPTDRPIIVVCHHGVRSAHAAAWLRSRGFAQIINLAGGLDAWARRIDPQMEVY